MWYVSESFFQSEIFGLPLTDCSNARCGKELLCSCRADCVEIGDCCLDIGLPHNPYNTDLETPLLATAQSILKASLSKHLSCRTLPIFVNATKTEYIFEERRHFMASCGMAGEHDVPVCSKGFIFENLACAKQHMQESDKSMPNTYMYIWLEDFLCHESVIKPMEYIRASNFTYFVDLARKLCTTSYVLPQECRDTSLRMNRKCLTDTWECQREAMNESASLLQCLSHQDPVRVAGNIYHNQYCARCVLKETPLEVECAGVSNILAEPGKLRTVPIPEGSLRFSLVHDFDGGLHAMDLSAPVLSARSNGEERAEVKVGLLCYWFLVRALQPLI